ncbi:MAG TPA: DUF1501 domain-containing protein [Tepidisphaeraceae bacterium]|jgi:hypothetical protein|nr:DUF1501 domain-containing protein [Tepidisphaeraceae bacterium]
MNLNQHHAQFITRRHFLRKCNTGIGALALAQLIGTNALSAGSASAATAAANPLAVKPSMFGSKAKRVIYLHMSGAPPQHDLWDWKPKLKEMSGTPCPKEIFQGERFAFIKGTPKLLGSPYKFSQYGRSGQWISELLPHIASNADDMTFVHSLYTDQFNHAPAEMLLFTGNNRPGFASMGSWITYGLGSESADLPGYVVLISGGTDPTGGKSLWGSGYLPSVFQGVQCRSKGEPILYASNPNGMDRDVRRQSLDALKDLNEMELKEFGDPETLTRISQYELAYRMQIAVPEVMDIARESKQTLELYGAEPGKGGFANNCLLARRLSEKGVRFVQLFDWGWDCHGTGPIDDLITHLPIKCKEMDRPVAALLKDLKQRGLLDETLVIWGGEFGRTPLNEERGGSKLLGRDHHPHSFTIWMAGGGIKPGFVYGATDDLGYHVIQDKMHVHDLQATILHALGIDPFKFSYAYQGLNQRLIGPANDWSVHEKLFA